ncbi:MAG: tetratricopeptide repeat protein [Gemmatimonadales bacterium]
MMVRHQSRVAAAVAAMFLGGFPFSTEAQLVRPPNPDAPILVVVTFKSADKKAGVDFAESVRDKISSDVSYRDLQVQSKANIDATLQASGYDMTAALTEGDANLLAKQLRADEYIEGTINKTATGAGYTTEAWMVMTYDQNQVQPLGTFTGPKPSDVAKEISKAFQAAQKVYDDVKKCRAARREDKGGDAMNIASGGISKYPRSTLLRICEMQAMVDSKKPPADLLKVAQEILQLDAKSKFALQAEVDAYDQLAEQATAAHDSVKAAGYKDSKMATLANLLAADPTNTKLQQTVTYELAQAGKYDVALKIISKAVEDNPGDVTFTKLYWQLLYATKDYKTMVKVGDEMVKMDTSFADTTYYDRTIDAYRQDSAWANAAVAAAHATAKYPKRADYWAQRGQLELKAGQVQPAVVSLRRALEIDPTLKGARLLIVSSLVDANAYDSAMVAMHDAVKSGENADQIGKFALSIGGKLFTVANNSKPPVLDLWQKVIPYVAYADSVSGDRTTKNTAKFEMGVAHYYIATLMYPDVVAQKNCDGAKQVQDYLINASSELQFGGATNPAAVSQLMPAIQQTADAVQNAVKVFCAPPKKP